MHVHLASGSQSSEAGRPARPNAVSVVGHRRRACADTVATVHASNYLHQPAEAPQHAAMCAPPLPHHAFTLPPIQAAAAGGGARSGVRTAKHGQQRQPAPAVSDQKCRSHAGPLRVELARPGFLTGSVASNTGSRALHWCFQGTPRWRPQASPREAGLMLLAVGEEAAQARWLQ